MIPWWFPAIHPIYHSTVPSLKSWSNKCRAEREQNHGSNSNFTTRYFRYRNDKPHRSSSLAGHITQLLSVSCNTATIWLHRTIFSVSLKKTEIYFNTHKVKQQKLAEDIHMQAHYRTGLLLLSLTAMRSRRFCPNSSITLCSASVMASPTTPTEVVDCVKWSFTACNCSNQTFTNGTDATARSGWRRREGGGSDLRWNLHSQTQSMSIIYHA